MGKGLMKATQQAHVRAWGLGPQGIRGPGVSVLSFETIISGFPSGPFPLGNQDPGCKVSSRQSLSSSEPKLGISGP